MVEIDRFPADNNVQQTQRAYFELSVDIMKELYLLSNKLTSWIYHLKSSDTFRTWLFLLREIAALGNLSGLFASTELF